tara:strand:+ start:286 stop:1416 length:1131 start_codon:yes stop_codon:yes gene_type:complete
MEIEAFVSDIFEESMHVKRVESLSNAVNGVLNSESLAIHAIGSGLAQAKDLNRKHAVKQVDRLLSNHKIDLKRIYQDWVPYVVGGRDEIFVSMDWTEFDKDDHSTLVLSLQTEHGRNTPLVWKTYQKSAMKGKRNDAEDELLRLFSGCVPGGTKVTIVADRGFSDTALYHFLKEGLDFDYVIRMKSNILLTDSKGKQAPVSDYLSSTGRTKSLKNVALTSKQCPVANVVLTRQKGMKSAWFIATSHGELSNKKILTIYGKRWGVETSFRDIKDYKFGMGMAHMHTRSVARRDNLFLISALAIAFLTLLGKAGDEAGLERTIKVNTSKTRTYSYWRQGCIYYSLLPGMREEWLRPLMEKFRQLLDEQPFVKAVFSTL